MDNNKQPDDLAKFLGHEIVGIGVAWVAGKMLKSAAPGIVIGIVGIFVHAAFDAPVSQSLSELGL